MATNSGMIIGLEVCELYPDEDMPTALYLALMERVIDRNEYDRACFFWLQEWF